MSDDAPAAIMATTGKVSTLADNTLRIVVEIAPKDAKAAFALFGTQGTAVALARITPEAATGEMRKDMMQGAKGPHGLAYTLLYKAGFWFAPPLHAALGIEGEIEMMRDRDADPEEVSDFVKGVLHNEFAVTSLTEVAPERFRDHMVALGVSHLLPREF